MVGHLDEEDFVAGCRKCGFRTPETCREDALFLHHGLDLDGKGFVDVQEISFLEENYLQRKVLERSEQAEQIMEHRAMRAAVRTRMAQESVQAFADFKAQLKRQYGTLFRAWTNLDDDGNW